MSKRGHAEKIYGLMLRLKEMMRMRGRKNHA